MCGITGIYQNKVIDRKVLDRMTDVLSYRGPDDRGVFIEGKVGLGQRRLAILDLSLLGHQPMISQNKRFVVTFNGEIYNFLEIRKLLEKKNYKFISQSDTEVIPAAYQEWGVKALEKFNGMWAFIVYDRKEKKLFASRDRLGIKPLYYYYDGQKLLLASEIKAILEYPGVKVKVDLEALNEYFTFQNIYSDKTLFANIKLLPPASFLEFDGQTLNIKKWWDISLKKEKLSKKEWEEKILNSFKKAVKRHLISDVEIGAFLSGGMDSASITSLAVDAHPNIKTFTGGFDSTNVTGLEAAFDERKDAEVVAKMFSSEHYEMVIHSGNMAKVFPELVWHLEDLRVGMSYPNYLINHLASRFVKVVLSGAGGDELFGGYPWRYQIVKNAKKVADFDQKYYNYWSRLIKDNEKPDFFQKNIAKKMNFAGPREEYRKIISKVDNLPPVEKALYFELKTFLHGLLLVEDKISMASSIEVRVPFLDSEMIDLACSIPYDLKVSNELGKVVLRSAMTKLLPKNIVNKKKQGFSPPEGSWYRDESLPYVESILFDKHTLSRGFTEKNFVKKIIREHSKGKANHRLLIWSLLSFEWWCRLFLDGRKLAEFKK